MSTVVNILGQVLPLLAILGLICLWLWSSGWAGKDAIRRGKPGWLVGILVLLTWPLGFLAWVALRPNEPKPPFDLQRYRVQ